MEFKPHLQSCQGFCRVDLHYSEIILHRQVFPALDFLIFHNFGYGCLNVFMYILNYFEIFDKNTSLFAMQFPCQFMGPVGMDCGGCNVCASLIKHKLYDWHDVCNSKDDANVSVYVSMICNGTAEGMHWHRRCNSK